MPRENQFTKPMHLNLPVDVHEALRDFSEATGTPMSSFVVSVLAANAPAIRAMAKAAQRAKQACRLEESCAEA